MRNFAAKFPDPYPPHMTLRHTPYALLLLLSLALNACRHADDEGQDTAALLQQASESMAHSDYNTALDRYLKYIQAEERMEQKDTAELLDIYYNIGGIYSVYQNFAQALDMYEKGYRLSREAGNAEKQFRFLNNIVGASCETGDAGRAAEANARVKALHGVSRGMTAFYYLFNNGFIAGCRGRQEEKARCMAEAIGAVDKYRLPQKMKLYPYSEIYKYYESTGRLDLALDALHKYDTLAHVANSASQPGSSGQAYLYADCYKGLMRIYTKLGDKEQALHYQNEFFRYNDSLLNVSEFSKIKNRHETYEDQRTRQTIAGQQKTIFYQKAAILLLVVLVATAAGAFFVIRRQQRHLHDANVALFDRNNELAEAGRQSTASPAVSDRLVERINEALADETNFCDPEFNLATLAAIVGSNTNYVSQAINSCHNKNFRTLLGEYRIREAMRRMKDNGQYANFSIRGISESVGFKSPSNFIAAFKKMTGMTPSLYQKLSRDE